MGSFLTSKERFHCITVAVVNGEAVQFSIFGIFFESLSCYIPWRTDQTIILYNFRIVVGPTTEHRSSFHIPRYSLVYLHPQQFRPSVTNNATTRISLLRYWCRVVEPCLKTTTESAVVWEQPGEANCISKEDA